MARSRAPRSGSGPAGVFNISPLEIGVIAMIALIVLGPAKLPELARSVGRGMREFRGALSGDSRDDEDDRPASPPA